MANRTYYGLFQTQTIICTRFIFVFENDDTESLEGADKINISKNDDMQLEIQRVMFHYNVQFSASSPVEPTGMEAIQQHVILLFFKSSNDNEVIFKKQVFFILFNVITVKCIDVPF